VVSVCVFFFSSRRRHTRSKRDWSSDVCSSDLGWLQPAGTGSLYDAVCRAPCAGERVPGTDETLSVWTSGKPMGPSHKGRTEQSGPAAESGRDGPAGRDSGSGRGGQAGGERLVGHPAFFGRAPQRGAVLCRPNRYRKDGTGQIHGPEFIRG